MSRSAIHNKIKEEMSDGGSHINCKQENSKQLQRTAEGQEVTLSQGARDTAGQRERDRYHVIISAFVTFFFGLLLLT